VLDRQQVATLEALLDERLAGGPVTDLPDGAVDALTEAGLLQPDARERVRELLAERRGGRRIEWVAQTVTQGELLAAFADHCERDLDEVDVLERGDDVLVARWRRETSRLELRTGFVGFERLASGTPTMLLGDTESDADRLVRAFVDDADLRSRLAVCDLGRLERVGAVRSSVFVYLEWFLRDAYGVKLLPAAAFTQGLIDKGVISLGMG
jgi:hypothetical protein